MMKRPARAEPPVSEARERGTLDRATIVRAALSLLDETGMDGLSTRRLAAELGIKSASLYWHFKDKNELLDEMCGVMFAECLPEPDVDGAGFDWAEWLAHGARRIRKTALSRRDGAQVMARVRPQPVSGRKLFEDNVKTVMRSGLTEIEAKLTMQALRRYAIGAALQEQATPRSASGSVLKGEEGFEFGLQTFIAGLKARIAEGRNVRSATARKAKG
jgi:TetR/AcrR family tetracycline transcriptional repressor